MKLVSTSIARTLRVLLAAVLFTACHHGGGAAGGSGSGGPDAGPPPPDCSAGCPMGYTCSSGVCTGGDAQKIAFDVKTYPVSGKLTVDGQAPVASDPSCTSQVSINFVNAAPRAHVWNPIIGSEVSAFIACATTDGSFSTRLPAGKYQVLAGQYNSTSSFPSDTFVVQAELDVTGPIAGLAWNPITVPISGKLRVNGQAPVASDPSCTNQVRLAFVDDRGGEFDGYISCGSTDGSFTARVAPGTYRVLASQYNSTSSFPSATFVVKAGFEVKAAQTALAWDLTTVPISGKLRVNGQAPVASDPSCTSQVLLALVNSDGGEFDGYVACASTDGSFTAQVVPGTYEVLASQYNSTSSFPSATFVVKTGFEVKAAQTALAWDLTTVPISGKITVDGQAPVASDPSCTNQVRVSLVDDSGDAFDGYVSCGSTDGSFTAQVAPGTYRVLASQYNSTSSFPPATFVVKTGFEVKATQAGLAWKLTTVPFAGTLKVDGQAPVASDPSCTSQVRIALFDTSGGEFDAYVACGSTDGSFSGRAAPGQYRFVASQYNSTSSFPDATLNLQDAIAVP